MAEGWKQVWDDFRSALRGEPAPPASEEAAPPAPEAEIQAEPAQAPRHVALVDVPLDAEAPHAIAATPEAANAGAVSHDGLPAEAEAPNAEVEHEAELPAPKQPLWRRQGLNAVLVVLTVIAAGNLYVRYGGDRFLARLTAPKPPAPDVVATFDGGKITTADLEAHFNALVPEQYRNESKSLATLTQVVREMASDELARRWASARKMDSNTTFQHTMEHIAENVNLESLSSNLHNGGIPVAESEIQGYYDKNKQQFGSQTLNDVREEIRQRLVAERETKYLDDYIARLKSNASISSDYRLLDIPEPGEDSLRAYYQANTQNYTATAQITVDMLTVPITGTEQVARAAADAALLKIRSGADFASIPASVSGTGLLTATVIRAGELGAEWDAAVKALQPGETSDVLRAANSFTIARMIKAEPERTLTFAEARPAILATVRQQQTDAWMQTNGTKTLFTLKGKQYTLGQFYKEYQELPPSTLAQYAGADGMKKLADSLIERLLVVEDTYDQLLQEKNKATLDQTRLDVLKQMMEQQEVDDNITVSDDEIKQFYDANQNLMQRPPKARIRYIRIGLGQSEDEKQAARAKANEAYQKLVPGLMQQGADFATVAKEYSEDPETAANGGELPDWIGETNDPLEAPQLHDLHQQVLGLTPNQTGAPFELGDSIYIVQPIERVEAQQVPFEEAKPFIKEELTNQKHEKQLLELQDRLTKQSNLVMYDIAIQAYYDTLAAAVPQPTAAAQP